MEGNNQMKYRKLGKTNLQVSEIGFGCTHFPTTTQVELNKIFEIGIEAGMNFLDVCISAPEQRDKIGNAIFEHREKLIIQGHIGLTMEDGQYARTQEYDKSIIHINDLLKRLNTDYLDIVMLHCIDQIEEYENAVKNGVLDYMLEQKEKGIYKYLGFSSHEPSVASKMVKSGHFDVVMFSICPVFDFVFSDMDKWFDMGENDAYPKGLHIDERRANFYKLCEEKGIGIIVMKALAAGGLVTDIGSPFGKAMTVPQCIHYALNRPAVGSVFIGFEKAEQLDDALAYCKTSEKDLDYSHILNHVTGSITKKCLYCNHCLPCPSKINIGAVTKILDMGNINGVSETLSADYKKQMSNASECIKCGLCVKRCPFGIDVIKNMKTVKEMFKKKDK